MNSRRATCSPRSVAAPTQMTSGWTKAGIDVDARGYIKSIDELRTHGRRRMGARRREVNGSGRSPHPYNDHEIVAANRRRSRRAASATAIPALCTLHRPAARPRSA